MEQEMKMAKKPEQSPTCSASVVDGKLILSLPDAYTPIVWQMDIDEAKSSALEVREETKNGRFTLTLKAQNGETKDIASYEERTSAVRALMATAHALENAHGKIRPQSAAANANNFGYRQATEFNSSTLPAASRNDSGGKSGALIATAMIVVLVIAWTFSLSKSEEIINKNRTTARSESETGVPVSADDFLSKR